MARPVTQGRVYHLDELDALPTPDFIQDMLSIHDTFVNALIDTGATHSFILCAFICKLDIIPESLAKILMVETPSRRLLEAHCIHKGCKIKALRIKVFLSLILLNFSRFDVY